MPSHHLLITKLTACPLSCGYSDKEFANSWEFILKAHRVQIKHHSVPEFVHMWWMILLSYYRPHQSHPATHVMESLTTVLRDFSNKWELYRIKVILKLEVVCEIQYQPLSRCFVAGNIKYISVFYQFATQIRSTVVEILLRGRQVAVYSAKFIPWLQMTWWHKEPGLQQSWCCPSYRRILRL